jgi:hypothetical protein
MGSAHLSVVWAASTKAARRAAESAALTLMSASSFNHRMGTAISRRGDMPKHRVQHLCTRNAGEDASGCHIVLS